MIKQTKTRYSKKFNYYSTDEVIGRSLELYGEYGQDEVNFLISILNQFSIVYDIGANIGYHTTAFASVARKVYAFEPNPHNYALLTMNTMDKKNVRLLNCAVGEKIGTINCSDYDPSIPGNFGMMHVGGDGADTPVVMLSIDEMNLQKPDVIKIDVEGAEYGVFKGAIRTITKYQPVLYYEAHETKHFKEIYEMLAPLNYNFYWAQVSNFNPGNLKKNSQNIFGNTALYNVIAWPKSLPELPLMPVEGSHDDINFMLNRVKNKLKNN